MITKDQNFRVHPTCKPIKGTRRSVIYDLDRYTYHFIPNTLYDILVSEEKINFDKLKVQFDRNEHIILDEYFKYLIDKELIFTDSVTNFEYFSSIQTEWSSPSIISNVIVEDSLGHDWQKIIEVLNNISCKHLQIRLTSVQNFLLLLKHIDGFIESSVSSIEVHLPYDEILNQENIQSIIKEHLLIVRYFIYNSPKKDYLSSPFSSTVVYYRTNDFAVMSSLQPMNSKSFAVEISQFIESHNHNIYFNKKITIDKDGFYKMSPHDHEIFGHIDHHNIREVVKNDNFTRYWGIKKDDMLKCKGCELRYMCCYEGVPVLDAVSGKYYYDQDCGYDPVTAEFNISKEF